MDLDFDGPEPRVQESREGGFEVSCGLCSGGPGFSAEACERFSMILLFGGREATDFCSTKPARVGIYFVASEDP